MLKRERVYGLPLFFPLFFLAFPFLPLTTAAAGEYAPPVRQGVDIYNAVGSNQRLIAFMKIGADHRDRRYLTMLNAKISSQPPPRAFLAGQMIYFKGLEKPLKVVDLKQKIFSFSDKRIDFKFMGGIEERMAQLERIVFPRRSAFIFWDWVFPFAFAATEDPRSLTILSGVLAVGGLTTGIQCLTDRQDLRCSQEFMGTLAAVGAVGGLRGNDPAALAFCSPDFLGGQKFVIAGRKRNLLSVSSSHGQYEIAPAHLQAGSPSANNAARELLGSCKSAGSLANMNIALAYPGASAVGVSTPLAVQGSPRVATRPTRAPAAVPSSSNLVRPPPPSTLESFSHGEQGGAAR